MNKNDIKNLIINHSSELMLEIDEQDMEFYIKSVDSYLSNIDEQIKNFDLSKYKNLNFTQNESILGSYRRDEIIESSENVLNNSIEIKNGYVVLKNVK